MRRILLILSMALFAIVPRLAWAVDADSAKWTMHFYERLIEQAKFRPARIAHKVVLTATFSVYPNGQIDDIVVIGRPRSPREEEWFKECINRVAEERIPLNKSKVTKISIPLFLRPEKSK